MTTPTETFVYGELSDDNYHRLTTELLCRMPGLMASPAAYMVVTAPDETTVVWDAWSTTEEGHVALFNCMRDNHVRSVLLRRQDDVTDKIAEWDVETGICTAGLDQANPATVPALQ